MATPPSPAHRPDDRGAHPDGSVAASPASDTGSLERLWPQLTTTSFVVLGLIAQVGPATSYDLQREAAESIGHYWAFARSQLYAEPQRLVDLGLLAETQEQGGRRRRHFALTDLGRTAVRAWLADTDLPPRELRDQGLLKLSFGSLAEPEDLRALARSEQARHRDKLATYEGYAPLLPPSGATAHDRAALEMGMRYERVAIAFWADVEQLADTGVMPLQDPGPPPDPGPDVDPGA